MAVRLDETTTLHACCMQHSRAPTRGDTDGRSSTWVSVPAGTPCASSRITAVNDTPMQPELRPTLRQRLQQPGLVVAPGVHDMVSLRMADACGFDALYMTGFGTVASHLGLPDAGLATYTDMVGRVRQMAAMARTPLIADGDTGYGGLLNVAHTVQGYEAAGAAAIQLEDQEVPKKCGHTPGRHAMPPRLRSCAPCRRWAPRAGPVCDRTSSAPPGPRAGSLRHLLLRSPARCVPR